MKDQELEFERFRRGSANLPETTSVEEQFQADVYLRQKRGGIKVCQFSFAQRCKCNRAKVYEPLQQTSDAGPMQGYGLNRRQFCNWLVMTAEDDHIAILNLLQIAGEMSFCFLNVDSDHVPGSEWRNSDWNSSLNSRPVSYWDRGVTAGEVLLERLRVGSAEMVEIRVV